MWRGQDKIFMLMRISNEQTQTVVLHWMPMEQLFTRKHAHLAHKVFDVYGPGEIVMRDILQLLVEVFEYAVRDDWCYEKQMMMFYRSFPFDGLDTTEAVEAFRPVLFECPAYFDVKRVVPEAE